jgi:hypothetical protein
MSKLQKVGDELAATSRHRSFSGPRIICRREIFISYDESGCSFR